MGTLKNYFFTTEDTENTESGKRKTLIKSIFICLLFNNKTLFFGLKLRVLRGEFFKVPK
jgi:hypothetical protein